MPDTLSPPLPSPAGAPRARLTAPRALGLLLVAAAAFAGSFASAAPSTRAQAGPAVAPAVVACASLAGTSLVDAGGADSRVTSARETEQDGIATCRIEGVLAPAVRFALLLPITTWTGRYLQLGCGGLCGRLSLQVGAADGCMPLQAGGFAIASTDMGHDGNGGAFGQDAGLRADFAHRAQHVTAVAAKALIRAYYGRPAAFAYFNGCSDGGREALVEAQRYPDDFDGIVAGASALNFQVQNGLYHAWQARANTGPDGKPILLASRLPLLHAAVLAKCDGLDGAVDGLVSTPLACRFDPAVLKCTGGTTDRCLSAAEVDAVRRLYDGPRDPQSGERLTVGGPQPGSELNWAGVFVPNTAEQGIFSEQIALEALQNLIFAEPPAPGFKLTDLRFDQATFDRLRARHPLFDATNPDLSAFVARGGKLILWHGWADPHISPLNTIAYHEAVQRRLGEAKRASFERLYLLPGVGHCGGGDGPASIDLLTPLMQWVEHGKPAGTVIARRGNMMKPDAEFGQPGAMGDAAHGAMPSGLSALPGGAASGAGRPPALPNGPPPGAMPAPQAPAGPDELALKPHASRSPVTPAWRGADFFQPYAPLSR